MDIGTIAQFAVATLMPVMACIVLTLLRKRTSVARVPERGWQVIVGVIFGLIAIYGTEAGIPLDGAMMPRRWQLACSLVGRLASLQVLLVESSAGLR